MSQVVKVLEMTRAHAEMFYLLFSKIDVDFSGDVDIWVSLGCVWAYFCGKPKTVPHCDETSFLLFIVLQEFADFYELTLSLFIQR
jgi:hypothetical protein